MGLLTRNSRAPLIAALSAAALFALPASEAPAEQKAVKPSKAAPQQPQKPPANDAEAKRREAEAAKRAYDEGIKSYQAGKYQPAVDELSTALRGGGLASTDMARGLYLRGLSYKKLSKPGLAISDLTSALWLKNGLNDADRKSATAERAEAYKAAGLGDGNSGADTVAVSEPAPAAAPATAAKAPAATAAGAPAAASPAVPSTPAASEAAVPQPLTTAGGAAPAEHSTAKVSVPMDSAVPFGTSPMTAPAAAAADRPAAASTANTSAALGPTSPGAAPALGPTAAATSANDSAAPASTSTATSSVSGFFSSLLPGKGSTTTGAPASVTTASTTAAPSSEAQVPSGGVAGAAEKAPSAKTAAKPTAAAAPKAAAAPAVKGGKYKVHIAALRSRAEADALAQKIVQQHGAALNNRAPTVDEAVIGSMGKFYRVRIGSYATADEPRGLCNTLRNSGYDCLVVSN